MEISDSQLQQIHNTEMEMLLEIDRICRKYQINYTIIGGTLLGAVRHGGFIPWDDDADIAMLRTEYNRFTAVLKEELDEGRFYFQDMDVSAGYRWGYGKLRRKGTVFLREGQEHMPYEQGIFIDIFPQDAVPDHFLTRRLHDVMCFLTRKVLWSEVGRYTEKNRLKKAVYNVLSKIPEVKIKKFYHKLILSNDDTELVRTLTFPAPKGKYGYRREWLTETADMEFNHCTLRGVKDFDGWLQWEFGDYMKIPPAEKRKVHPVSELKLGDG